MKEERLLKKAKELTLLLMLIPTLCLTGCSQKTKSTLFQGHVFHRVFMGKHFSETKTPSKKEARSVLTVNVVKQLGGISQIRYDNGSFSISNGQSNLDTSGNGTYANCQKDELGRPAIVNAILDSNSLGKNVPPKSTSKPLGYRQRTLNTYYKKAFVYGRLIPYSLSGGIQSFNTADMGNVFTQTEWAARAHSQDSKGMAYYTGLIKDAIDQGKVVRYQAVNIYEGKSKIPMGTHIQAKSTDGQFKVNSFIPNIQSGIEIDYGSGIVSRLR